jgi:hypothetical protein
MAPESSLHSYATMLLDRLYMVKMALSHIVFTDNLSADDMRRLAWDVLQQDDKAFEIAMNKEEAEQMWSDVASREIN